MDIGIPVETHANEYRVGLNPQGVSLLTQAGHRCYVQRDAGAGAGFKDVDYERAGARIVYAAEEVYSRADLVLKVVGLTRDELVFVREGQTICGLWHLPARPREITHTLLEKDITAVAYEAIQLDNGHLPVLRPLSEIAGRMAPQIAARWLQNDGGGSGLLLSGLPGIPPTDVCVIGAGTVGMNATRAFVGLGARVYVLDKDLRKLQEIDREFGSRVVTMVAYDFNIARVLKFADVVVTGVLEPDSRSPILISRELIRHMRPRSVILDISIDQGGCVETSRPTTHADPVFVEEGVIHYCVPNMPGVVGRTATHAYLNAAWTYIHTLAEYGPSEAPNIHEELGRGIVIHNGKILSKNLSMIIEEA